MGIKVSIVVGGRWHAFDVARELNAAGVLHRIITNYPKYKTRQWGIPDEKVVSLPLTALLGKAIHQLGREKLEKKSQAWLHKLFANAASHYLEGSTVIHGWSSSSEPSVHWAKQNGVPFVMTRGSSHIQVQLQLLKEEYHKLGLHWIEPDPEVEAQELREYDLVDRVIVSSFFAKGSFIAKNFPENRLFHNPLGTNLRTFSPGIKQDDVFRVIYAGSLNPRKGIHYLVPAFMEVDIPNSQLYLVGGATPETPLLLKGADERVKCIGHLPQAQLAEYYRNSSVFVMPSIEDGFGTVMAQALACGLPLICTTNTGGEDLLRMSGVEPRKLDGGIEEFPAGYLVDIRNSNAIRTCLKMLAEDKNLLLSKQEAALSISSHSLSWSNYARRAIKLYEKISANSEINEGNQN